MRILALDTSTKSCSVAILDGQTILAESTSVSAQTHAVHLIEMVQKIVDLSGLALSEMDGFAVGRGPGSFTGLRIGISTIKALAVAAGKPVVGVSNLDALAMQAAVSSNMVCPLMDARKGEVYFSRYCYENGNLQRIVPAQVSTLDNVLSAIHTTCVFIGEGARIYQKKIIEKFGPYASFAAPIQNTIRASTIGQLSVNRFKQENPDDVVMLAPEYIRKSDAELGFGHKNKLPQIQP
ncbi:MAG: tRNA (adenosine(37)-N6)-threonylcarbamoyltransferase complex dimerization subunit type 1 TsaB [Desulfobacterales bacterium]|nr:tRNA (adenosine(37)-N6)-threonylcarbamoyltransferase complex dimerization subunit type 1 TsaB [Desulfobacterales bacterium]